MSLIKVEFYDLDLSDGPVKSVDGDDQQRPTSPPHTSGAN